MGGGAGCPSSVRMVLVDVDSSKILGMVRGGIYIVETVVELMEVTRLWDSGSIGVSDGIRFGHSMTESTAEEALNVWSLKDCGGVQSIVDVSFGICWDQMFELSCFSSCETMLIIFAEC